MTLFSAVSMIETKRSNQRPHTEEELKWWIETYCSHQIPDYQMAAWLMAVCWRGMTLEETGLLTKYMVQSGRQLEWNNNNTDTIRRADKHSSGGVGDKISLVLAPLVAAYDDGNVVLQVPMMAGRGLGHTGGTLDKLESIPGFTVSQSEQDFSNIVETVGCSIVSTTDEMVLADRKLYALRDVTGTVSCIPLQTASITSKKIAENPDSLVLDVKYGRGSFQSTLEEALELASSMIYTAEMNGIRPTVAYCTHMDIPIGRGIGNWLEVKECLDMMSGGADDMSKNLRQLVLCEAAQMIQDGTTTSSGKQESLETIVASLDALLESGVVLTKFREMVAAQGGDVSVVDHPEEYPTAPFSCQVLAPQGAGFVSDMNALVMGQASVSLGAGREVAGEAVDALAGLWLHKVVGEQVEEGDVVVTLYTSKSQVLDEIKDKVAAAIEYSPENLIVPPAVSHMVTRDGVKEFHMPTMLL